ncbi:MAG: hypothetical protein GF384_08125 [Elusimicrobia bacterium]|nr:hypothetical protein [Elusimicrobiota bacterium]MBD3412599.1 hypothetical protein [Elusimicrobiota bacterium]
MVQESFFDAGLIGNNHTAALVRKDGTIGWCCMPSFHDPSVFSSFLSPSDGGYFAVRPAEDFTSYQHYIRSTNVLETAFKTKSGTVICTDFMSIHREDVEIANPEIIRVLRCCEGEMMMAVDLYPKFNNKKGWNKIVPIAEGVMIKNYDVTAVLAGPFPFRIHQGHALSKCMLRMGQEIAVVFCYGVFSTSRRLETAIEKLVFTIRHWRTWLPHGGLGSDKITGDLYEAMIRSTLMVRLSTFTSTGLTIESPAVSLKTGQHSPILNDGRITSMYSLYAAAEAFMVLGYKSELEAAMNSVRTLCREYAQQPALPGIVRPDGNPVRTSFSMDIEEQKSVRAEYASAAQQFGPGLLSLLWYDYFQYVRKRPDEASWDILVRLISMITAHWHEPGNDFWREDPTPRQYLFTMLVSWAGVDRGIRLAGMYKLNHPSDEWTTTRQTIRDAIMGQTFDRQRMAFKRAVDDDANDATALLMPRFEFCKPDDPTMVSSVECIKKELGTADGLLDRCTSSDHSACSMISSIWLAEYYIRAGSIDEAKKVLNAIIQLAGKTLLFPEYRPSVKQPGYGLYPSTITHAEYIRALSVFARTTGIARD